MKKHLTITDIARITEKERSTVFRWIKAGKFGSVRKLGNEYQVSHNGFSEWWQKNVTLTNPEGES